ncbi:hypothetical protein PQX77_018508 [Marasmius sp. AFHP31]|nr:hypothetical protein PQX77_018508 [Marasmius sp. AFHP31]
MSSSLPPTSSPPPASNVADSPGILGEDTMRQLEEISPNQDKFLGPTPIFVHPLARQPTTHAERNPLLPIQPVEKRSENSKRKLTEAQLASRRIACEDRRKIEGQLNADVISLASDIETLLQGVADKNHVVKEVVRDRLSSLDRLKKSKACGRMQALVRLKGLQVNPDCPVGEKLKAHQLLQLVKEDPKMMALSGAELSSAMKEAEIARLLKLKGAWANNRAAGWDYTSTCDKLTDAFDNVYLCTGAVGFGFLVMPTRKDEGEPTFFIAGPDTPEFVRQHLHMEMWDLLNKAELWASDRAKGNHRDTKQMCEDCLSMIASGLYVGEEEDENGEEDDGGEGAGEPSQKRRKRTQRPAKAAPKPKKTTKTKGNGASRRVSKQLPPQPRSKSIIGDETDSEASAS